MSLLIATFPETREIGMRVAKALGAGHTGIFVNQFPDSEFHLALRKNPKNQTVVIISSIAHEPDKKLIETILAGGIARDYGAKKVILIATYMPYLRQDKHFEKYDSFSSKYIMALLSNFDKIIAVDPHLHRIKKMQKFSRKASSITTNGLIANYIKKRFKQDFTIVGPDEESAQWSQKIADLLGKKVVILHKTRISGKKIKQQELKSKDFANNVILIDDIISTGKTLVGALQMAKKQGAKKLVCIGIHGMLVNNADKLIRKHAELITTNTIPNKYAKIDISQAIIDAIKKYK